MGLELGHVKFQPSFQGEHFQIGNRMRGGLKKCVFSNRKLAISRKRWWWEIWLRLLLIKCSVRLDGNHWPWMTLKAVTRYCG